MQRTSSGTLFRGKSLALTGYLGIFGLLAGVSFTTATARERVLIDSGWRFQLGDPVGDTNLTSSMTNYPEIYYLPKLNSDEFAGTSSETYLETNRVDPVANHAGESVSFVQTNYDDSAWRALDLPHDWVVELPFDQSGAMDHGYKAGIIGTNSANTVAWYRHTFAMPANYSSQSIWLEFDGVYRNCLIWLNGHILGRNVSGYNSFSFDITPYANPGGTNVLVVRVDASRFEGWFYEGAGIYRHVWLVSANPVHVAHWGTYVATTNLVGSNATITVQTTVTNQGSATVNGTLTSTILDANSNAVTAVTSNLNLTAGQGLIVTQTLAVANANLWSLQTPYLYNLVSTVSNAAAKADVYNTTFGVRMVRFDPTNGVFINDQHVEIQGTCNHQDHAGVGSALPDRLQYFRIERLKEMGVNAYRTSHNPPTPELLDACDRLGMLVLDEARRFGTNVEPLFELRNQVMRDRNHPSVFAWSLANEEWNMQTSTTGQAVMAVMQNLVHSLDSTRKCTAAINGSLGGTGFTAVLDVQGLNYNIPGSLDSYHSSNPNSPIIGTEVGSTVTTRGIYTNDQVNGYVASYDYITQTKSGLLINPVTWGETAEAWWQYYSARPWSSGGFDWTGLDYRGEPTPFSWPCINSHFGSMDTCGFPKDLFYYYQANWSPKTVLHVFPHWNWSTTGQVINVWAYGNCDAVELFTNNVSLGQKTLSTTNHVEWNVPYVPGTLKGIGYRNGQPIITNTVETTGTPAKLALWPDRRTILADGRDVSVVTVAVLDSSNRVVPIATNLVNFTITGGAIIGVGNGNPSSHEPDKTNQWQRQVFNGLAEVIVQSTNQTGSITLTATSTGLTSTNITITAAATLPAPDAPAGVVAALGDGQVTVAWDVMPGATGYNLKRATTSSGPYTVIVTNTGALGYTDTNITPLTIYYYVVSAVNSAGEGSNSAEVNATWNAFVTVTATVVSSQVQLNWNAHSGVTGYNVKRSLVPDGPYTTIAGNLATTTYTDADVGLCQTYYYVVTMMVGSTEGPPSPKVAVTVPDTLPSSLTSADIGSVGAAGSAGYCSGQYFVDGAGTDIWNTVDAFQFVYVPMNGDGEIRARVVSVENTDPGAMGGVMIRETLTVGSRHMLVDVKANGGLETIRRTFTGANSSISTASGSVPYWVRLTRTGTNFQAYYSADGSSWTAFSTAYTIKMGTSAYAGLAVCSRSYGVLCSAVFDNVYISSLPANTAPVLNPISNVTTNVGGVVTNTAAASDAELSSQTLTFSLLSGPASATLNKINSTNAAFNWRPQVADANTTNSIILKVADNGSPALSATQSFSVKVNPLPAPSVSSATFNNGQLTLRVTNSLTGPDYGVLVSSNLVDWHILATNSPTMNYFQWTDTNAVTLPARFYRIKVGPPLP